MASGSVSFICFVFFFVVLVSVFDMSRCGFFNLSLAGEVITCATFAVFNASVG